MTDWSKLSHRELVRELLQARSLLDAVLRGDTDALADAREWQAMRVLAGEVESELWSNRLDGDLEAGSTVVFTAQAHVVVLLSGVRLYGCTDEIRSTLQVGNRIHASGISCQRLTRLPEFVSVLPGALMQVELRNPTTDSLRIAVEFVGYRLHY